jgi:endonuclease YncB( thermonuclease family)
VIDGDMLEIHGKRVRPFGIDAPESRQTCFDTSGRKWRCGQQAASHYRTSLAGAPSHPTRRKCLHHLNGHDKPANSMLHLGLTA